MATIHQENEYTRAMILLDQLGETLGIRPWDLESAAREVRVANQVCDFGRIEEAYRDLSRVLAKYENNIDF